MTAKTDSVKTLNHLRTPLPPVPLDMSEPTVVVNIDNQFVRWAPRAEIHRERLFHRTVHIAVFSSTRQILLQRRTASKRTHPNHWDLSCAGHVEPQDDIGDNLDTLDALYLRCAQRELAEELGIEAYPTIVGHYLPIDGIFYEQLRLFSVTHDGPFVLQAEEVAEVRFVNNTELEQIMRSELCTESLVHFGPRLFVS